MPRGRRKRIPWSPSDVRILRKLAGRKAIAQIARELKRTVAAVRFKAHTERIRLAVKRAA